MSTCQSYKGNSLRPITFTEIKKHKTQTMSAASEASVTDFMTVVHVMAATLKNNIMASRMQAEVRTQSSPL
jgi:hypothetical protein